MTTLVMPPSVADRLRQLATLEVETGAVLLVRPVESESEIRLLAAELHLVPDAAYERRGRQELLITSDGYVPALGRAEELEAIPIWLHTHPGDGASPRQSKRDIVVDGQLAELFRLRSNSRFYGALVVAHRGDALRFSGHIETDTARTRIDRLWCVGPRFSLSWNVEDNRPALPALFDRNVRAFGGEVQRVLGDLRIGVVGCGGTGSAVAEQLVRLGVRHLVLIDPDELSESNVTRVYGSRPSNIGEPKAETLARYLRGIAPDAEVTPWTGSITAERHARRLVACDAVFGCTDDNAGRLVLSRLATYLLVPVIDCGVLLSSNDDGYLRGIHGRVTLMYPGVACLVCRNRIDLEQASSEMLSPGERSARVHEGYAPALPGVEPAVVAYTSMVASSAVAELIERLTRYGPEPAPSEILLRIHDREVSTNDADPRENHYCHPDAGKLGLGLTDPFLEQTWPD